MFRAISSALTFFFLLLVIRMFAPQVFDLSIDILMQMLTLLSQAVHQLATQAQSTPTTF